MENIYCRKCMSPLSPDKFYDAVDKGLVDANGKLSVCKPCIQLIYDELYASTGSLEKAIHGLCIALNIKYSNDAVSATKANITTLLDNGKKANSIFGIYKSRLVSSIKSMSKDAREIDLVYSDVGTIFTTEQFDVKEAPIPQEKMLFWSNVTSNEDIRYLENEYVKFSKSHSAVSQAEITLLQRVCYTLLAIKKEMLAGNDTDKLDKTLQSLMGKLAISPDTKNSSSQDAGLQAIGLWIRDLELYEPAQWLKVDPRGDMYRDVGDVEGYFQKYFVRPIKNFITQSKDFNVEDTVDTVDTDSEFSDFGDAVIFDLINDGEIDGKETS